MLYASCQCLLLLLLLVRLLLLLLMVRLLLLHLLIRLLVGHGGCRWVGVKWELLGWGAWLGGWAASGAAQGWGGAEWYGGVVDWRLGSPQGHGRMELARFARSALDMDSWAL